MLNNMIKNDRITPQYITSLKDGEIFVFGSNKDGMHGGGAARIAHKKFGAMGVRGKTLCITHRFSAL